MHAAARLLIPHASARFNFLPRTPASAEIGVRSSSHAIRLDAFYEEFNGGDLWDRALLIRPVEGTKDTPHSVAEWNDPSLWKNLYEPGCEGTIFFAEDAFGMQFGIREGRIVQFDPETATIVDCAETLQEWATLLNRDPAYYTGAPVLAAWEAKNSTIRVGHRLLPKKLFMLGGDFHSENMTCKSDVEGLRVRAQLWRLTRELPEGQRIELKAVE